MYKYIKTFFIFGLGTFIEKVVPLFFLPIYAKTLSVDEFGTMELLISIIAVVSIFAFLQLETSLQRNFYELIENDLRLFITNIIFLVLLISIFISLLLSFNVNFINQFFFSNRIDNKIILFSIWQIPFLTWNTFASIILRFRKNNLGFILLVSISSFVSFFLLYIFIVHLKWGLYGYFLGQLISLIITFLSSLFLVRKNFIFKVSLISIRESLEYALPQFPARIGSTVNVYFNRFFINGTLSAASLGLFAMAFKISTVYQLLYQVFLIFWSQLMFEFLKKENFKEFFVLVLQIVTPLLFLLISITAIFSSSIVNILSAKFYASHSLIGFLSFSFGLLVLKEVVDIGPKYHRKTFYLTANFFISVIVNVLSLIFLVPLIGLIAVGISIVIANLVLFITSWYNSNRLLYIPFDLNNVLFCLLPSISILILDYFEFFSSLNIKIIFCLFIIFLYGFMLARPFAKFKLLFG